MVDMRLKNNILSTDLSILSLDKFYLEFCVRTKIGTQMVRRLKSRKVDRRKDNQKRAKVQSQGTYGENQLARLAMRTTSQLELFLIFAKVVLCSSVHCTACTVQSQKSISKTALPYQLARYPHFAIGVKSSSLGDRAQEIASTSLLHASGAQPTRPLKLASIEHYYLVIKLSCQRDQSKAVLACLGWSATWLAHFAGWPARQAAGRHCLD